TKQQFQRPEHYAEADARGKEEDRLSAERERLKAEAARKAGAAQTLGALDAALAQARARFDAELARYHPAGGRYLAAKARLIARAAAPVQSPLSRPLPVSLAVFAATLLSMTLLALVQSRVQAAADRRAFRQAAMPIDEVAMPVSPGDDAAVTDAEPRHDEPAPAVEAAVARAEAERPIVLPARAGTPWFAAASAGRMDGSGAPRLPKAKKSFLLQGGRAPMQHAQHMGRMGELDADAAARRFISGTSTRAIFVSPEGDEAAAVAILTARAIADAGLRVLLLDLTASGAASRPMLESASMAGITDLLVREAQFTDAIHQDHFSDCHVIPVGMADPNRAMRAADRLPVIIDSLTAAYDIVVVECGPADAESIRGLVSDDSEIVVSLLDAEDEVARAADALIAAGYERTMVVAPGGRDHLATFSREAIRDRWLADNGAEF
ncbi:MAG: tyrosine-protein kinase family protein, partial [Rhizobiaceae bacterium]